MTDQQVFDSLRHRIEAGERLYLTFDLLPLGNRIEQQAAMVGVDGNHKMSRAMMLQLLTVARRHSHAAFRIQIDGINAAKHLLSPLLLDMYP